MRLHAPHPVPALLLRSSGPVLGLLLSLTAMAACSPSDADTGVADTTSAAPDATGDAGNSDAGNSDGFNSDTSGPGDAQDGPDAVGDDAASLGDAESADVSDVGLSDVADVGAPDASGCDPTECAASAPACRVGQCVQEVCVITDASGPCDDGDPCTGGDYCLVGICAGFALPDCCTVKCEGKSCGADGCGGTCGTCQGSDICDDSGSCVAPTQTANTCAEAVPVPSLPYTVTASTVGLTNNYAVPNGACYSQNLGTYGADTVYRYVPDFDGYLTMTLSGVDNQTDAYVLADCADPKYACLGAASTILEYDSLPVSVPVTSGHPVYVVVDTSTEGTFTLGLDACIPDCAGKECGLDGCGHWCATCPKLSNWECSTANTCVCLPSCNDKTCGDDGCGGSCGTCAAGKVCEAAGGGCVTPGQPGDTCDTAIAIASFPGEYKGNTLGYGNDLYSWAFCVGNGTGAYLGYSAPDVVFTLQPDVATTYYVSLTTTGFNGEVWAMTDCADPVSCVQAGYKGASLKKQLLIEAAPGVPTYLAVSAYQTGGGPFTLKVTECHEGADCAEASVGDYCSFARPIAAVPFAYSAFGLQSAVDAYTLPATGACSKGKPVGKGASEDVFVFTPTVAGQYTLTVKAGGQFDPVLYVATDCVDMDAGCLAAVDATGMAETETLVFSALAGTPYYLIVDGFTPYQGSYQLALSGP